MKYVSFDEGRERRGSDFSEQILTISKIRKEAPVVNQQNQHEFLVRLLVESFIVWILIEALIKLRMG